MIQQYIDNVDPNSPETQPQLLRLKPRTIPNIKQQVEEVSAQLNEKIRSLNRRIKTDQSVMAKEVNFIKMSVELFREKTQAVLVDLESGVDSALKETNRLEKLHLKSLEETDKNFLNIQGQLNAVNVRLDGVDDAVEDVEHVQNEMKAQVSYKLLNMVITDHVINNSKLQEETRLFEMEKMCEELRGQVSEQSKELEQLRRLNLEFQKQIREELGRKIE